MADSFDVDAMVSRFQERAKAVRNRPLPPLEGTARREYIERAQLGYQDFAMGRDAAAALEGDPSQLREATREEGVLLNGLADKALSILAEAGNAATPTQRERLGATLRAAATDPAAGDLLQRGTLTTELSPAGFGFDD